MRHRMTVRNGRHGMRRILLGIALGCIVTAAGDGSARADSTGNQLSLRRNELTTEYRKVTK